MRTFKQYLIEAEVNFDTSDTSPAAKKAGRSTINRIAELSPAVLKKMEPYIGKKATSPELLPQLIVNAPQYFNALKDHIFTDMTLDEMIQVGLYASQIALEDIQFGAINESYIAYYFQQGVSVATPDGTKLAELLKQVFGDTYNQ